MLAFADIEAPLCNGRHDRMQLQEARIPKQLHGIEFACFCLSHPGANPRLHRHLCLSLVFRCSLLLCATWCFIALCFTKICIVNFSSTSRWYGPNKLLPYLRISSLKMRIALLSRFALDILRDESRAHTLRAIVRAFSIQWAIPRVRSEALLVE